MTATEVLKILSGRELRVGSEVWTGHPRINGKFVLYHCRFPETSYNSVHYEVFEAHRGRLGVYDPGLIEVAIHVEKATDEKLMEPLISRLEQEARILGFSLNPNGRAGVQITINCTNMSENDAVSAVEAALNTLYEKFERIINEVAHKYGCV